MLENRIWMLVPLDGSPEAESILPALMPLFKAMQVRLTLLGVASDPATSASLELYLTRLQTSLLVDGIPSEAKVEQGDPAEMIVRATKAVPFDLIALATHARTGLRRDLIGSVAEEVLRQSGIPVLAFRLGTKIGDWKRMVVGLDGSAVAETVLADAAELARMLGATLHLVRVWGIRPRLTIHPGDAFPVPEEDPQPYLDRMVDALAEKGLLALAQVRRGDAAEEVVAVAQEIGAGLICLGTHGRTGLARKLLGSIAAGVLEAAPCPVLLRRTVASAVHQAPAI